MTLYIVKAWNGEEEIAFAPVLAESPDEAMELCDPGSEWTEAEVSDEEGNQLAVYENGAQS